MDATPTLDALADEPQLVETIADRPYRFSELPLAALSRLQGWIKSAVPHPLDEIRPRLDGFTAEERQRLIDRALELGRYWPPRIGTLDGSRALLGNQEGQLQVLLEGLRVHQPEATEDDAARLYRDLNREVAARKRAGLPAEARVERIYAVLFGNYDPAAEGRAPKAGAGGAGPTPGATSSSS